MAFYYISLGRYDLSSLLLTLLLCLSAYRISAQSIPPDVTEVKITNVNENSFNVSWMPSTGVNVTNYTVIINNNTANVVVDVNTTTNSYAASDLSPGVTYDITIYANDNSGNRSSGVTQKATTLPSSVTGFQVTAIGTNQATLSWTPPPDVNAKTYTYNISIQPDSRTVISNTSSVVITGLLPGSNYNFTIYTVTQNGVWSSKSQSTTNTTKPSPVLGLVVSSVLNSSLTLAWMFSTDPNAKSYTYTVKYAGVEKTGITQNTTEITNLTPGTNYNFTVYAVTPNAISSETSNVANATTKPSPVLGLAVSSVSNSSVTLAWMFSTDPNAKSYTYTVKYGGGEKPAITQNTTDITNLTPGTNYNFTVYAVTSNGISSETSNVANATTKPSPVLGLVVSSVSNSSVTLAWMFSTDSNAKSYTYIVKYGGGEKPAITQNTTEITNLTPGTNYNFTVYAVTPNGISSETSNVANVTTQPNIVQGLVVLNVSETTVTLQWNYSQDKNYDTYTYTVDGQGVNFSKISYIRNNSIVLQNLSSGIDYTFKVFAVTDNGIYSQSSETVNATTRPSTVPLFKVSAKSNDSVSLTWTFPLNVNVATYTYAVQVDNHTQLNTTNNTMIVTGLSAGVTYSFTIYTVTKNGIRSLKYPSISDTTRPNAPINLQGNAVGSSEIDINWTAPGDINDKLYDYQVTWEDTASLITITNTTNGTYLNINQLLPGHLYKINVTSVIKNTASATYAEIYAATKSLSTQGLSGSKADNTSVTLTWNIPSDTNSVVSGYRVTVYLNGNQTFQYETNETMYVVNNLLPGTVYNFSVESYARYPRPGNVNRMALATVANYITSYSTASTMIVETDPDPVGNLKCSKSDAYQISVVFDCPAGSYSEFKVLVNNGNRSQVNACPNDVYISNLQPAASYKIRVMTIATNKVAITDQIICDTDSTGVIVGSIFGVLLFILLIAVIVYLVLRFRRKKGGGDNLLTSTRTRRFHTIPRDKFKLHYENNHTNSDFGFADEYQELSSVGSTQSKRTAEIPENRAKNRFTNVLPYDHSRVKLSAVNGISTSDYINANYMPGYNSSKEFIASQGPLPNTTADFWRMVWEHQVNTIVMLTNCMENGRVKCEHYWPLDYTPCTYEDLTVTVTSETILSEWTLRDFSVKHANQPGVKYVRHFHFTAWPDHGVPDSTSSIIHFRNLVREHMDQRNSSGPTVVHCSAGVGRTGTLIALDYLIQQMEHEQRLGIYSFVEKMRNNRNLMVQTEAQYIFLNKCMLDLINQPEDEHIYENHNGTELVYENLSAIRNHQMENA